MDNYNDTMIIMKTGITILTLQLILENSFVPHLTVDYENQSHDNHNANFFHQRKISCPTFLS